MSCIIFRDKHSGPNFSFLGSESRDCIYASINSPQGRVALWGCLVNNVAALFCCMLLPGMQTKCWMCYYPYAFSHLLNSVEAIRSLAVSCLVFTFFLGRYPLTLAICILVCMNTVN